MPSIQPETLPGLLLSSAARFGDAVALEEDGRAWSFRELAEECLEAAAGYMAAGVGRGERVAVWAPNSARWIFAALGAQAAGAVLVPLNTRFKGSEAAFILNKCRVRTLVSVPEFIGNSYLDMLEEHDLPHLERRILLDGEDRRATLWEDFLAGGRRIATADAKRQAESVQPGDLCDIMFTSGTTGDPKGVMIAHSQNLFGYRAWTEVVGLAEGDRYLIVNPFFHAFGYKAGWMACIMRGATILPHAVFDVGEILSRVQRERISVLPGPPTLYQSILSDPDRANHNLSTLRLAITGAAAIPPELIRRIRSELGFDTGLTGYGLTESAGLATNCRRGDDAETIAITSGPALPGVEVRIAGTDGASLPADEAGEVLVKGPNVMRGYFEDEEATRRAIDADGWLHTGDIGVLDERGYLRITDRMKDMFIMGGFNCYPAEIEKLMFEMEEIAEVAVIGVPDVRMGEVGMAFVVPVPGTAPDAAEIVQWCRGHMANYKVPRFVKLVESLPRTASGKVQKFVLRELALEET